MIAGGNAVAFNVHPNCRWTSMRTVELLNEAIVAAGGPGQPVRRRRRPDARVGAGARHPRAASTCSCITGGAALIRDAFGTGKRVIAAGPGVPVVGARRDRRPGARRAPRSSTARSSRTRSCASARRAVVAADAVHDRLLAGLRRPAGAHPHGATRWSRSTARSSTTPATTRARAPEFVGKDAEVLLAAAGLDSRKPVGPAGGAGRARRTRCCGWSSSARSCPSPARATARRRSTSASRSRAATATPR